MADLEVVPALQTQFNVIYGEVLSTVRTQTLDVSDLVTIATAAMTIVQKYPELSGAQKKELVVDVIQKIVDDSGLISENQKETANHFVKLTLPPMIDVIVSAYQHNIDLKKIQTECFACVSRHKRR